MTEVSVDQAAQAMYAAHDALKATIKGSDEYVEARMRYAAARDSYDDAYQRKLSGYSI